MIFFVDGERYGLETRVVKEVVWVPELYWNHSLPTGIAGVFPYRGTVLPVLHLPQWFGGTPRKLRIHDQVIVVEWQDRVMGLLVDKVQDVTSLVVEQVDVISPGTTARGLARQGVVGVANIGKQSVNMLDLSLALQDLQDSGTSEHLIPLTPEFLVGTSSAQTDGWIPVSSEGFEELTQEDHQLLQERADVMGQTELVVDTQKWITLAVVCLNEDYVGLDPLVVREFAELGDIVPIPCCPKFVLGNMNLRGEVLTVFDLRCALNMPIVENLPPSQVAVIQFDSYLMGIAVQKVLDCVSCQSHGGGISQIGDEAGSFMNVVSHYQGKPLKYLDVSHLLSSKVLEVYEEV